MPERSEVWYTDGNSGFYNLKLAGWPFAAAVPGMATGDCTGNAGFRSVSATPTGRRVRLGFTRRRNLPVRIDVFQVSQGRRVVSERRVARFTQAARRGRAACATATTSCASRCARTAGASTSGGSSCAAHDGRFTHVKRHYRRGSCELLRSYKLERPVFGGRSRTPLRIAYRLTAPARVTLTVTKGKGLIARRVINGTPGRTYRVVVKAKRRGVYKVRLVAEGGGKRAASTLTARRL